MNVTIGPYRYGSVVKTDANLNTGSKEERTDRSESTRKRAENGHQRVAPSGVIDQWDDEREHDEEEDPPDIIIHRLRDDDADYVINTDNNSRDVSLHRSRDVKLLTSVDESANTPLSGDRSNALIRISETSDGGIVDRWRSLNEEFEQRYLVPDSSTLKNGRGQKSSDGRVVGRLTNLDRFEDVKKLFYRDSDQPALLQGQHGRNQQQEQQQQEQQQQQQDVLQHNTSSARMKSRISRDDRLNTSAVTGPGERRETWMGPVHVQVLDTTEQQSAEKRIKVASRMTSEEERNRRVAVYGGEGKGKYGGGGGGGMMEQYAGTGGVDYGRAEEGLTEDDVFTAERHRRGINIGQDSDVGRGSSSRTRYTKTPQAEVTTTRMTSQTASNGVRRRKGVAKGTVEFFEDILEDAFGRKKRSRKKQEQEQQRRLTRSMQNLSTMTSYAAGGDEVDDDINQNQSRSDNRRVIDYTIRTSDNSRIVGGAMGDTERQLATERGERMTTQRGRSLERGSKNYAGKRSKSRGREEDAVETRTRQGVSSFPRGRQASRDGRAGERLQSRDVDWQLRDRQESSGLFARGRQQSRNYSESLDRTRQRSRDDGTGMRYDIDDVNSRYYLQNSSVGESSPMLKSISQITEGQSQPYRIHRIRPIPSTGPTPRKTPLTSFFSPPISPRTRLRNAEILSTSRTEDIKTSSRWLQQSSSADPISTGMRRGVTREVGREWRVGGVGESKLDRGQSREFSGREESSTVVHINQATQALAPAPATGPMSYGPVSDDWVGRGAQRKPRPQTLSKGMVTRVVHEADDVRHDGEAYRDQLMKSSHQIMTSPYGSATSPRYASSNSVVRQGHQFDRVDLVYDPRSHGVMSSPATQRLSDARAGLLSIHPPQEQSVSSWRGANQLCRDIYRQRSNSEAWHSSNQSEASIILETGASTFSNQPIVATDVMSRDVQSDGPVVLDGGLRASDPRQVTMSKNQVLNFFVFGQKPGVTPSVAPPPPITSLRETERAEIRRGEERELQPYTIYHKQTQTAAGEDRKRDLYVTEKKIQLHAPTKVRPLKTPPPPSEVHQANFFMKPQIIETRSFEMESSAPVRMESIESGAPVRIETGAPRRMPSTFNVPIQRQAAPPITPVVVDEDDDDEMVLLETTTVEEKEQRICMEIREDVEFSLLRTQGGGGPAGLTGGDNPLSLQDSSALDDGTGSGGGSAGGGMKRSVEPWWIPDSFEAVVDRRRQKTTKVELLQNEGDYSIRREHSQQSQTSDDPMDQSQALLTHSVDQSEIPATNHKHSWTTTSWPRSHTLSSSDDLARTYSRSVYDPDNVSFATKQQGRHLANGAEVVEETEVGLRPYDYESQQVSLNLGDMPNDVVVRGRRRGLSGYHVTEPYNLAPPSLSHYDTMMTPF